MKKVILKKSSNIDEIRESFKEKKRALSSAKRKFSKENFDAKKNFLDLGHTRIDTQREARCGYGEVIFGQGKTPAQIIEIMRELSNEENGVLATRLSKKAIEHILINFPNAKIFEAARIAVLPAKKRKKSETERKKKKEKKESKNFIAIVSAGTSDFPLVEEAKICAEFFGSKVKVFNDCGVAGVHRLMACIDEIRKAKVCIAVAGMEGALPSVLAGLVSSPVIALPTSVGYGANFGGLSALLAMLNSCANGVSVVNIDNGFGAAYCANLINKI